MDVITMLWTRVLATDHGTSTVYAPGIREFHPWVPTQSFASLPLRLRGNVRSIDMSVRNKNQVQIIQIRYNPREKIEFYSTSSLYPLCTSIYTHERVDVIQQNTTYYIFLHLLVWIERNCGSCSSSEGVSGHQNREQGVGLLLVLAS